MSRVRRVFAVVCSSVMLAVVAASPAAAANQTQQGLVNVAVGDITIKNVSVGVAAQIVANVCPNVDVNAAVLVQDVLQGTQSKTYCTAGPNNQNITVSQAG